eukprot:Gb_34857 [translate_table: standard]
MNKMKEEGNGRYLRSISLEEVELRERDLAVKKLQLELKEKELALQERELALQDHSPSVASVIVGDGIAHGIPTRIISDDVSPNIIPDVAANGVSNIDSHDILSNVQIVPSSGIQRINLMIDNWGQVMKDTTGRSFGVFKYWLRLVKWKCVAKAMTLPSTVGSRDQVIHGCYSDDNGSPLITLKEVEKFLLANLTEIITIIVEDYVHASKGLTRVFTDARLMKYMFPISKMPKNGKDWPTITDMVAHNQRLLVFTSNSSKEATEGIAYQWNYTQWNYTVENKYGYDGTIPRSCLNREESLPLNSKNVQHLIEKCLMFDMDYDDCVEVLAKHAKIKPIVTLTVWKELVKENKDFFRAYFIHKSAIYSGTTMRSIDEARTKIEALNIGDHTSSSDATSTSALDLESDEIVQVALEVLIISRIVFDSENGDQQSECHEPMNSYNQIGIWVGMIFGTAVQTIFLIFITWRTDWDRESTLQQILPLLDVEHMALLVNRRAFNSDHSRALKSERGYFYFGEASSIDNSDILHCYHVLHHRHSGHG